MLQYTVYIFSCKFLRCPIFVVFVVGRSSNHGNQVIEIATFVHVHTCKWHDDAPGPWHVHNCASQKFKLELTTSLYAYALIWTDKWWKVEPVNQPETALKKTWPDPYVYQEMSTPNINEQRAEYAIPFPNKYMYVYMSCHANHMTYAASYKPQILIDVHCIPARRFPCPGVGYENDQDYLQGHTHKIHAYKGIFNVGTCIWQTENLSANHVIYMQHINANSDPLPFLSR